MEEVDEAVEESDAAAIEELDLDELLEARKIFIQLSEEEHALARNAYRKLDRLGHRIFNSERLRKELAEIANNMNIDNATKKRMIRAVLTRWNTVTDVLTRGLELQPALDRLCSTSTGRASIKALLLSNEEWQVVYQLQAVLKPFKDATLRLSTNKHPRIFEVIPIIDILNQHLEAVVRKTKSPERPMSAVVRMAAVAGLGITDKYYSKTDESIMYRVAMRKPCCFIQSPQLMPLSHAPRLWPGVL
ncbi:hypothetical protein C8F01DRAFT_984191 [Mycena amicta]|nr:hypothetical protein C8F01DRAFT_984191 [Mycena amicta]